MSIIIYQDHIEILEQENADLQREVRALKRTIQYYKSLEMEDQDGVT